MNSQIEALKEKWKDKKLNDEEKVKQLEEIDKIKEVVKLQHEAIGILIER